jgi:hypothetical protein
VLTAIAVLLTEDKRYVDTVRRARGTGAALRCAAEGCRRTLRSRLSVAVVAAGTCPLTRPRCARRRPPAAPHLLAQRARHLRGRAAGRVALPLAAPRRVP